MREPANQPGASSVLVFWIIWGAILNGMFVILFFAAGGVPKGVNVGEPPVGLIVAAAGAAVAAMAVRFVVIPRLKEPDKLLVAMVIGLFLAEVVGMIGMFVIGREFPQTRLALFGASVSAVLAFAPIYAHKLPKSR